MRANCTRKSLLWAPAMVAVLTISTGLVWSTGGADGTEREVVQTAPIELERGVADLTSRPGAPTDEINGVQIEPGSVLVHLRPAVNRASLRAFAAARGAKIHHEYKILPNVINMRNLSEQAIEALKRHPDVVRVEEDRIVYVHLTVSTPLIRALQSQITGAGLSADGSGVRVCVIDTGIDSDHIMYSDRIDTDAGWDFVNNDNDPEDDNGHGTNVAGIVLGGTGLSMTRCGVSTTLQGVAPEATLIGIKVLNSQGSGTFSNVIAGIDYCADQSASGAQGDVANLSLGGGQYSGNCDSDSAAAAANNAVDAGVVVVASSGNDGYSNAMGTPACGSKVIAVGAVYDDDYPNCEWPSQSSFTWCLDAFCFNTCTDNTPPQDSLICFSNQSDTIDVAAPGCITTSADNAPGGTTVSGICGTSQAAPHVAGLAALILSADGSLTPAEVRQIIRDGAIDMGSPGFDRGYGYGRIDAINSLQLVGPECQYDWECDDDNVCTDDACVGGFCEYTNNTDPCDDGLFCNGADTCSGGSCSVHAGDPCEPGETCDEVNDVCIPMVCDNDGTCEEGEDCNNCPNDCISGEGVVCGNGLCEAGDGEDCNNCPADCNGLQTGKPDYRFCCGATEGCSDSRCTTGGWSCTTEPQGEPYCCGDGVCQGAENVDNCAVDCGCTINEDCDDSNECTDDFCVDGVCQNPAVPDNTVCTGGICCGGECTTATCTVDADCDDADTCTTDSCLNGGTCAASCEYTWPACGLADGCCGPACTPVNDPDCCVPKGGPCTSHTECCSGICNLAAGKCK